MNTLAAIIELLKADSAIATLVSTRIYYQNAHVLSKSDFPCILVNRIGGPMDIDDDVAGLVREITFDVRCYGDSQPAANAIYEAIRNLSGQIGIKTTNYFFHVIDGPGDGRDLPEQLTDATRWDCVYGSLRAEIELK